MSSESHCQEQMSEKDQIRTRFFLHSWKEDYPQFFRAGKFAAGSAVGFFDTEIILTLGTYLIYGKFSAPPSAFSSPNFVALNVLAFVIGVTVAFFINEFLIVRLEGYEVKYDILGTASRLAKFQLFFLAGNLVTVGIELLLLKLLAIPPVVGVIIGAVVAFPLSYFFSMHFIWRIANGGFEQFSRQEDLQSKNFHDDSNNCRDGFPRIYFHHDPLTTLPERIVTANGGAYCLDVHENRFDVFSANDGTGETRIEFALRLEVCPEEENLDTIAEK